VAAAVLTPPTGSQLALKVPTVIAPTPVPASGPFTTTATGSTPSLVFSSPGTAVRTVARARTTGEALAARGLTD
ncbi:MAG: 5'-nucleotidase, partial [Cellulomonas sp.]|nr:5'-nucleotidase [Cellulomonas sp.]